ncbi:PEP/pyruvate-binding domain-containing protein [Agromyces bauzanensis]
MITDHPSRSVAGFISLDDPDGVEPALVGNKAATLAVLRRSGFDVPPGVVVPVTVPASGVDELPAAVRTALANLPGVLGADAWAVRSSGTAEDGEQASFAGQFLTLLDVGTDALSDAVVACRRSAGADRVAAYRGEHGAGRLAVLIQPMVHADAAGVAFSMDPVTGRIGVVIEAVAGLGERLVSGEITPERWRVDPDGSTDPPRGATVLTVEQATAIADLARRVAAHLGRPQDIEWAYADGALRLLQARPITGPVGLRSETIPIPLEVPPGYWERDDFHEPVPISPFGRILLTEQILKAFPGAFAEFGVLLDRAEVAFIGGWQYGRIVPLVGPAPGEGSRTPPRWLLAILLRLHPAVRRRSRAARDAVAADLPMTVIRRWYGEWRPEHRDDLRRALALDLGSLSDAELAAELDHRVRMLGHPAHIVVAIGYWVLVYELAERCRESLGWEVTRALGLVEGLSTTSTEPGRQLAGLARLAGSRPATAAALTAPVDASLDRLAELDPAFAAAFDEYVADNAHRTLGYDVIDPTMAETPDRLLRLVADQLETGFAPDRLGERAERRRREALDEARRLMARQPAGDRERFERALARAREAYPALEDRVWWTTSVQAALLRYLALELGARLAERGQLDTADDVFFLEVPDARAALLDGADRRETARIASGQRAWAMAHPVRRSYGHPPVGEPPFDLLPPAARLVNEATMWGVDHVLAWSTAPDEHAVVSGAPASPGRYTGRVRVVRGEQDFDRIRAGDVVVCPATSPAWSVVFPNLGALVTDSGGILSHPAIIAREYGIPAVVGTGNATRLLVDDQVVTVDGDRGVVEGSAAGSSMISSGSASGRNPDFA